MPVVCDPAGLLPQGIARRWGDTADDNIADLTFGVTGDYVNDLFASHGFLKCRKKRTLSLSSNAMIELLRDCRLDKDA